MKKMICVIMAVLFCFALGCAAPSTNVAAAYGSATDKATTQEVANRLQYNQPTPTDIEYSLERYNLIRRAYWVNGMRERANTLVCEIEKPLGYIVLFAGNAVVGSFVVDGKVSSLNSYLTPSYRYSKALQKIK